MGVDQRGRTHVRWGVVSGCRLGVGPRARGRARWDSHLGEEGLEVGVVRGAELAGERLVDRADVERADLGEAGEHVVAEGLVGQELVHEVLDQRGLEDVAERDPVEKLEQRLEGAHEKRRLCRVGHDVLAQL